MKDDGRVLFSYYNKNSKHVELKCSDKVNSSMSNYKI